MGGVKGVRILHGVVAPMTPITKRWYDEDEDEDEDEDGDAED